MDHDQHSDLHGGAVRRDRYDLVVLGGGTGLEHVGVNLDARAADEHLARRYAGPRMRALARPVLAVLRGVEGPR